MTTRYNAEKWRKNVQPVRSIVQEGPRRKDKQNAPKLKKFKSKKR